MAKENPCRPFVTDITDDVIVEFETATKDITRKPIYQGDTVKAHIYCDEEPQILDVIYRDSCFVIDYEDSESNTVPIGCFVGTLKVIGTIHDEIKGA